MRKKVFGRPTFSQFIHGINKNQAYFKSDGLKKDLHHLILVCGEYNKVYNAKTGNDTDRIEKPSYQASKSANEKIRTTEDSVSIVDCDVQSPGISREIVLSAIRRVLKNEHINEGNSVGFLDLQNRKHTLDGLCKELESLGCRKISHLDIMSCKNIKEVIDLVINC